MATKIVTKHEEQLKIAALARKRRKEIEANLMRMTDSKSTPASTSITHLYQLWRNTAMYNLFNEKGEWIEARKTKPSNAWLKENKVRYRKGTKELEAGYRLIGNKIVEPEVVLKKGVYVVYFLYSLLLIFASVLSYLISPVVVFFNRKNGDKTHLIPLFSFILGDKALSDYVDDGLYKNSSITGNLTKEEINSSGFLRYYSHLRMVWKFPVYGLKQKLGYNSSDSRVQHIKLAENDGELWKCNDGNKGAFLLDRKFYFFNLFYTRVKLGWDLTVKGNSIMVLYISLFNKIEKK